MMSSVQGATGSQPGARFQWPARRWTWLSPVMFGLMAAPAGADPSMAPDAPVRVEAAATTPNLGYLEPFPASANPYSVQSADLNGDGLADLAVSGAGAVTVLLNTSPENAESSSFTAGVPFATGSNPHALDLVDLNADGKPDLATANNSGSSVSVLLNTTAAGAATPAFAAQQSFGVASDSEGLTHADINLDGKPDLIAISTSFSKVSVLLNTTPPGAATPTFAAQQAFGASTPAYNIAAADLNDDGLPDLVVCIDTGPITINTYLNTTAPGSATVSFSGQ